jgi:hypothetical protein
LKLVVAGTYEEFLDWCRDNNTSPGRETRYVSKYEDFVGWDKPAELVLTANYDDNPVYENGEIWKFLLQYADDRKWTIIEEYKNENLY